MDDDYEDEPSFEPTAKDELTAIRHILKRMEMDLMIIGISLAIFLFNY